MDIIELERWKPSEANPHKLEYAGQPVAQEVFEELKHRLEGMGYLPDEYFLLDDHWKDGREIPKDADIFCTTDYGASEGVYLDVYLKWYEEGKPITRSFITGKTLGEKLVRNPGCILLEGFQFAVLDRQHSFVKVAHPQRAHSYRVDILRDAPGHAAQELLGLAHGLLLPRTSRRRPCWWRRLAVRGPWAGR